MSSVLTEFIGLLTGGLTTMATGIGGGLQAAVTEMFLTTSESGAITGLSTLGGTVAVFGGIALAVGLTTLIFNWITSIGK